MKKSILNISVLLIILSVVLSSCSKDDVGEIEETAGSFTMEYDGVTYTEVEQNSLILVGGNIGVAGVEGNEFGLIVSGVGADGTTTDITDANGNVNGSVMLDFGAVVGKEGFVATGGTIQRIGKTIEISATGLSTSLVSKSLTATIEVVSVIAN